MTIDRPPKGGRRDEADRFEGKGGGNVTKYA